MLVKISYDFVKRAGDRIKKSMKRANAIYQEKQIYYYISRSTSNGADEEKEGQEDNENEQANNLREKSNDKKEQRNKSKQSENDKDNEKE